MRATERLRRFQRDDVRPTVGRAVRDVAYALAYMVSMLLAVAMVVISFDVEGPNEAMGVAILGLAHFALVVAAFLLVASGASVALAVLTSVQGIVVLPFVLVPLVGSLLCGLMCLAYVVVAIASGRRRVRAEIDAATPTPI